MISEKIENALNNQVKIEATSSMQYLAMASWSEVNGFNGVASFFYKQSEEERMHMVKLMAFINERGGKAIVPSINDIISEFDSLENLFNTFLESEEHVTQHVNEIVHMCLEIKDYNVHNFMQWYVSEQLEEEASARTLIDKLKIIGNDKGGLYLFDRDLQIPEN
ncbi:ferritin [Leptobacterium sp. I13]|uniref:ferritin n=1 Tax=Leptobacterium meishanense TaxID=3128904 RepID=UPI0030EB6113